MEDCYIKREDAINACENLLKFYDGLKNYYKSFGLNIESNRGRRNILMSEPMEHFVAVELAKSFESVISDGRTGKADIVIEDDRLNCELECKLTSPHESSGSIVFQTDYETLAKKGSLDYIYIIANADFTGFCVVFFKGLTLEDFRSLSPGARGKVQMYKHKGMKKATILVGESINRKDLQVTKLENSINVITQEHVSKTEDFAKRFEALMPSQIYDQNKILDSIEYNNRNFAKKINKLEEKIIIKKNTKSSYSFKYEVP